jgi:hypothetical protein
MNLIAFIIGILMSISVIVYFKRSRLENSKLAYPILLFTLPFYYFVFAIYGNDSVALALEIVAGLLFFIIAMPALKINYFYKFPLLSLGYTLHAVYKVIHDPIFLMLVKSELNSLTHRISQRVAGFLEREGLLVTDDDNDYLALDGLEDAPMLQVHGYFITYRIATGKQQ